MLSLLRDPNARRFLLAHAQSQLGTGAGFVALLVLAYERLHSPWAISLVLLADFLPAVVLGPVFGMLADRVSRRALAVAGDGLRAVAFVGIVLADSFAGIVAFALLAGLGTGLFRPAVSAALPGLVDARALPKLTALHSGLTNLGATAGPGLAAIGLLVVSPATILSVNAGCFALSALLLLRVRFGCRDRGTSATDAAPERSGAGLRAVLRLPGLRLLFGSSVAAVLFGAMINVAEPLLAHDELGAGGAGYAALAAVFGLGTVSASVLGGTATGAAAMRRRYAAGLLVSGVGLLAVAFAPTLLLAAPAFLAAGFGMGSLLVHEAQLLQLTAPSRLAGRMFGLKEALDSAAFGTAFLFSGAFVGAIGVRPLFGLAGAGVLVTGLVVATQFGLERDLPRHRTAGVRPAAA